MSMFQSLVAEAAAPAAGAAQGAQSQGNPWMQFLPLILIFGVMMFFMMRSQKKQQQKRQQMLDKIVKGSRVLLNSGMLGTVVEVKDSSYQVEIADKVQVEVVKSGVAEVIEPKEANPKA